MDVFKKRSVVQSDMVQMPPDILLLIFSFFMTVDKLKVVTKSPLKDLLNVTTTCKCLAGFMEFVFSTYMLTPTTFTRYVTDPKYVKIMASRPRLCALKMPEQRSRNYTVFDRRGKKFLHNMGICIVSIGFMGIRQGQTLHKVDSVMLEMLSLQPQMAIKIRMYKNFQNIIDTYVEASGLSQFLTFEISERVYVHGTVRLPKGEYIKPDHSIWTLGMEKSVLKTIGMENAVERPSDFTSLESEPHVYSYLTCDEDEVFVIMHYFSDYASKEETSVVKMKKGSSLGPVLNKFLIQIKEMKGVEGDLRFVCCHPVRGGNGYRAVDPEDTANQATGRVVGVDSFVAPLHTIYLCPAAMV